MTSTIGSNAGQSGFHAACEAWLHNDWQKRFAKYMVNSTYWRSRRSNFSWKLISNPLKRICLHISSRRLPDANRYALLPTPTASDGTKGNRRTSKIVDGKLVNMSAKGVKYGITIGQLAVAGMLPTPTARTWSGNCSVNRRKGNLEDRIASELKPSERSTKINAFFITEMMGYPTWWISGPFARKNKY